MTNNEAVTMIKNDMRLHHNSLSGAYRQALNMAVEALKFRDAYKIVVEAANKAFENKQSVWMEWIPCSERLPGDDEIMLVTCQPKKGNPNVNRAYYMDGAWHGSGSMSNVVAWMPLPEPWKGADE